MNLSRTSRSIYLRLLLGVAVLAMVGMPSTGTVHAASKSQLEQKLRNEQAKIKADRQRLANIRGRYSRSLASLKVVEARLTVEQSRMTALGHEVSRVRSEQVVTEEQLAATEKKLTEDRHTVSGALQAFQVQGAGGFLNVLMSSQSLEDFIQRVSLVGQLVQSDVRVLNQISGEQDQLTALSRRLQRQRAELVALHRQSVITARNLSGQKIVLASDLNQLTTETNSQKKAIIIDEGNETAIANQIKALESPGNGKNVGSISFIWPLQGPITSPFGMRFDPVYKRYQLHAGIDIGVPVGTPIHAAAAGRVLVASWITGWGYVVEIDHGGGVVTLYAHESRIASTVGELVTQGQVIGYSGSTGATTGPCLHFGLYLGGNPVNPMPYLPPGGNA